MVNIFDTLPRNFFNIFNTADRVVISECICVLYEYIKDDASFASLKENLISIAKRTCFLCLSKIKRMWLVE